MASPSVITIQRAGLYLVIGAINWGSNALGYRLIQVARNGNVSDAAASLIESPASGVPTAETASGLRRLNVGDTLQVDVEQTSGTTLAVRGITPSDPLLEAVWLGP